MTSVSYVGTVLCNVGDVRC